MPDGNGGQVPLPDLPEAATQPVGALTGAFSVSDQGTAQYAIPIQVPPGRAGIEPVLSLRYSASRVSSEAGIGWRLEGLSQITRCPRTYALDGYAAPIRNDLSDRFCIDGKPLELVTGSAGYGLEGAEYRTLVDTFTKVVSRVEGTPSVQPPNWPNVQPLLHSLQGPDYFQVWTKEGRILTYGRTRDSLVMAQNGVRSAWLLNRVEDRVGNRMDVAYTNLRVPVPNELAVRVTNLIQPRAIYYTGHGSSAGTREVRFDYENQLDGKLSFMQGGTPMLRAQRLHRITTLVHDQPIKNYRLEYVDELHSELSKVFECAHGDDTVCKQPTSFSYEHDSGFTGDVLNTSMPGGGELDLNGDGRPDFIVTQAKVGDMPPNTVLKGSLIAGDAAIGVGSYIYLTPVGGIAANAFWSVAKLALFGVFADEPKVTFTSDALINTGNRSQVLQFTQGIQGVPCPQSSNAFFADYDQDGKDDIVAACDPYSFQVARSLGNGSFADGGSIASLPRPVGMTRGQPATPAPIYYDVNGDSLQDIVSCPDDGTLEVRLRAGPALFFEAEPLRLRGPQITGPRTAARLPFCGNSTPTYQIVDVDGDGAPELLAYFARNRAEVQQLGDQQGWFVLRYGKKSDGQFSLSWQPIDFPVSGKAAQGAGMVLGDLNGDGLVDVWRPDGDEATMWMNTGAGFQARTIAHPRPAAVFGLGATNFVDYDSNGSVDLLEHWVTHQCGPDSSSFCVEQRSNYALRVDPFMRSVQAALAPDLTFHSPISTLVNGGQYTTVGDLDGDGNADLFGYGGQVYWGKGLHNTLLSSITDGIGNVTHVQYDGTADTYTGDCAEETRWPEQCLKTMKGLVSNHRVGFIADGTEHIERTFFYKYKNARMSVAGHGWLGFDQRSVTESVGDQFKTVTTFAEPVVRYTPSGVPTSSTKSTYLYPLAGVSKTVVIDQGYNIAAIGTQVSPLETGPRQRRTVVTNNWSVKLSAAGRPFPFLEDTTTESFSRRAPEHALEIIPFEENGALRTSCTTLNLEVDGYGNVRRSASSCSVPVTHTPTPEGPSHASTFLELTETNTTYAPNAQTWQVGNPELIVTKSYAPRGEGASQTRIIDLEYDSNGLIRSVTRDPSGDTERSTYVRDEFGNVREVVETVSTGEASRTTLVSYDADDLFPQLVANAKGHATQLTFDPGFGQVRTLVDANGIAVQSRYDGFGKRTEVRTPQGITTYDYAQLPLGTSTTTANFPIYPALQVTEEQRGTAGSLGGRNVQQFDGRGRVVRSTSLGFGGAAVTAETAYDTVGRPIYTSLPHVAGTTNLVPDSTYQYDYLNRLIRTDHSDGSVSERQFASGASLTASSLKWLNVIPCVSEIKTYCAVDVELSIDRRAGGEVDRRNVVLRDHAGRVVGSIDGENVDSAAHGSSYVYLEFGRLARIADNGGAARSFIHDDYGRLLNKSDPDSGLTQYTYNGFGQLKTSRDANAELRTYDYDVLGRLKTIIDSAGTTQWIYDSGENALGRLSESISPATMENPAGQHVLYDYEPVVSGNRGALESVTYALDSAAYTIDLEYDDLARVRQIDYPSIGSGAPVAAKYDYEPSSGALVGVSEVGSGTPRPIWHVDSAFEGYLVAQQTFGNGATSTFTYDPDRHWLSSVQTTMSGQTAQNIDYDYYGNGQVLARTTPDRTQEYVYDPLGRLRTLTDTKNNVSTLRQYDYDVHGNLTQNDAVTSAFGTSRPHLPSSVGANAYSHFPNGNLQSRSGPDIPGGAQLFQYTPFDLPKQIATGSASPRITRFEYTADGVRAVRRSDTFAEHYVSGLYEHTLASNGATLEEHFRITAGSRVVAEVVRKPGSGATLFFHPDHLGTPETITDAQGNVVHQDHDAFGKLQGSPPYINASVTRVSYTGHHEDYDLELTDMGGRVYDPLAARFTTADPVTQAPFWSQGLNPYAYVFNDPINATDPSGYSAWSTGSTSGDIVTYGVAGTAFGTVGYGIVTEIGSALLPAGGALGSAAGSAGGSALNMLGTLALSPGGPPPGATWQTAAPSAAPTPHQARVNSMGSAPGQSQPPGPGAPDGYRTAWEAARAALERYNPVSIQSRDPNDVTSTGKEYGGLIYETGGRYFFTEAVVPEYEGGVDVWEALDKVPEFARNRIVGDYHTHGGINGITDGEDFSGLHPAPGSNVDALRNSGDIAEARLDLAKYKDRILESRRFTSFLGTPRGRFGVHNPSQGFVFMFQPNARLLPPGSTVPASAYSWH